MLEYNVEYQETIKKKKKEKNLQLHCHFSQKVIDISVILNLSTFDRHEYFISV